MRVTSVHNPPNPWSSTTLEWLGEPPSTTIEIFEEHARSILQSNESPDVGFRWSLNPYRGCFHACAYCYARPSHQYLGFGAGTDFDRKIVVKMNAPELLLKTLQRKSWQHENIVFSGNTDCYQPVEASYQLTRRCLEICHQFSNPIHIITKSALIRRDVSLLSLFAQRTRIGVTISIPFAEEEMARRIEPYASAISARFETIRALAEAGVPVGVNVAPVIPGLSDSHIAEILTRAHKAGAQWAGMQALRLPGEVASVFMERLHEMYPERVQKVQQALVQIRNGKLNQTEFGQRMTGDGPRWAIVKNLFRVHAQKLGLRSVYEHKGDNVDAGISTSVEKRTPEIATSTQSKQCELFES